MTTPDEKRWHEMAEGTVRQELRHEDQQRRRDKMQAIVLEREEMPAHVKAAYWMAINLWAGILGAPR